MTDQPVLVTTTTSNLATILGSTLPFAGRGEDWDHPGLYGIQVHAAGGVITATATNRYLLGHARKQASGDLFRAVFLPKKEASLLCDTLSRAMEHRRNGDDLATLAVTAEGEEPARVVVEFCGITIRLTAGTPIKQLADLDTLFAMLPAREDLALSAPFLVAPYAIEPLIEAAKWSAMGARNVPLRWSFGGHHKPARVEIEDWFVAAVMPIKGPADELSVPTTVPVPVTSPSASLAQVGQG